MAGFGEVIDLAVRLQRNRYASVPCLYLESKLSDVCKFVTLKQSSGGVLENRGGDALNQVQHPLFQILVWLSLQNRFLEDDTECLRVCEIDTRFSSISNEMNQSSRNNYTYMQLCEKVFVPSCFVFFLHVCHTFCHVSVHQPNLNIRQR